MIELFNSEFGLMQENNTSNSSILRVNPNITSTTNGKPSHQIPKITGNVITTNTSGINIILNQPHQTIRPQQFRGQQQSSQPMYSMRMQNTLIKQQNPLISPNNNTNIQKELGTNNDIMNTKAISTSPNNLELERSCVGSAYSNTDDHNSKSKSDLRQIRNKWKVKEDLAFMKVMIINAHLLTYVEYFKPMKNFWIRVSQVLRQEYNYERNSRQCHDRFKVLYSKAYKLEGQIPSTDLGITEKVKGFQFFLLQLKNTFGVLNGNIILKSPQLATGCNIDPVSSTILSSGQMNYNFPGIRNTSTNSHPTSISVNANSVEPQLQQEQQRQQQQQKIIIETQRQYMENMYRSIYNVMGDLQKQVDEMHFKLDMSEKKQQEQASLIRGLLSMIQQQRSPHHSTTPASVVNSTSEDISLSQTNRIRIPSNPLISFTTLNSTKSTSTTSGIRNLVDTANIRK